MLWFIIMSVISAFYIVGVVVYMGIGILELFTNDKTFGKRMITSSIIWPFALTREVVKKWNEE